MFVKLLENIAGIRVLRTIDTSGKTFFFIIVVKKRIMKAKRSLILSKFLGCLQVY